MILCGVDLAPHAQLAQVFERTRIIDVATNQPIKHNPMEQPKVMVMEPLTADHIGALAAVTAEGPTVGAVVVAVPDSPCG